MIYLLVAVVIHYAHVHFKTTTLCEHWSDELLLKMVRWVVFTGSMAMTLWLLYRVGQVREIQKRDLTRKINALSYIIGQQHLSHEDAGHTLGFQSSVSSRLVTEHRPMWCLSKHQSSPENHDHFRGEVSQTATTHFFFHGTFHASGKLHVTFIQRVPPKARGLRAAARMTSAS